jgi:hypothetical protein
MLHVIDVAALDDYRTRYRDGMPYQAHREFYDLLAREYPEQNYWDAEQVAAFLDWCKPGWVVELGGWDGALAAAMLPDRFGIGIWWNYELADVPQVCYHSSYAFSIDDGWLWADGPYSVPCDAFIASHSLEHLTEQHLDALIAALDCDYAYVDVPLDDVGQTWNGSTTTHVLELSLDEFVQRWLKAGWKVRHAWYSEQGVPSHVRFFERSVD